MSALNRLSQETSPYLLQHAANPVDWYPWGPEALARARAEDKPILLSIGYSACHWCHVMAHESFEDPAIAGVMNARFINIKVDREERPDLDRIYQRAHQLLHGRGGGWPLTMFLTPDQVPFFGGTYFPPQPRHGLPAFPALLQQVARTYEERHGAVQAQGAALLAALGQDTRAAAPGVPLHDGPIRQALQQLAQSYDRRFHGFGGAPKFPHPVVLEFLLQRPADPAARQMALDTLRTMAAGGLQDQLGGGFFRYAVDARWQIPHFEKMLYDNALLLPLYVDAWQLSGDIGLREVAEAIATWVMDEMQAPAGGYYATQDADSAGREGGYYLWEAESVRNLLATEAYPLVAAHYGLAHPPNFEGRWHLHVSTPLAAAAAGLGLGASQAAASLATARRTLLATRRQRPAPGRDEKVLTAWNGLMIKAMASAGRRLGRAALIASAETALRFVQEHLFRDGRLLASYKDGEARHTACLDDYAFLLDGVLELLQARWCSADLAFATCLAEVLLTHFEDKAHGGFFFTADDHEALIQRPKPLADEATPAGNGVAARALAHLGHLLGDNRYLRAGEATLTAAWPALEEAPYAHPGLLLALEQHLAPPAVVVLRGEQAHLHSWLTRLHTAYRPHGYLYAIPADAPALPPALAQRVPAGQPLAYLCRGHQCQAPLHSLEALCQALAS